MVDQPLRLAVTLHEFDQAYVDRLFAPQRPGPEIRAVAVSKLDADERARELRTADALFVWNWRRELRPEEGLQSSARLVQLMSAGADHIPFDQMPAGAVLASNVGAYAEPMAEHVIALALAVLKRLRTNHDKLASGIWDQDTPSRTLRGAVCAVIGYGGIGRTTAAYLRTFGARIYAINTSGKTEDPVDFVGTLEDLDYVLAAADVVVLSLPLTRNTRGLIDAARLQTMKSSAVLVNVARGAIVEEDALFRHLQTHPDFTAAIDTWWVEPMHTGEFRVDHPFFELPNVLGSPHNSGIVTGVIGAAARMAADNIRRFAQGEKLSGVVRPEDYVDI